jgi:hypothetical protein
MNTLTITFKNNQESAKDLLLVRLPRVRAEFHGIKLLDTNRVAKVDKLSARVFQLHLVGAPLKPDEELKVEVNYSGEPFKGAEVEFLDRIDEANEFEGLRAALESASPELIEPELASSLLSRMSAIESLENTDFRRASIFFAEYDHQTYPPLVAINPTLSEAERAKRREVILIRPANTFIKRLTILRNCLYKAASCVTLEN